MRQKCARDDLVHLGQELCPLRSKRLHFLLAMIQFVLDVSLAAMHLLEAVALRVANGELQPLGCVPGLPFTTTAQGHSVAIFHFQMTSSCLEQEAHTVHGGVAGPVKVIHV